MQVLFYPLLGWLEPSWGWLTAGPWWVNEMEKWMKGDRVGYIGEKAATKLFAFLTKEVRLISLFGPQFFYLLDYISF